MVNGFDIAVDAIQWHPLSCIASPRLFIFPISMSNVAIIHKFV